MWLMYMGQSCAVFVGMLIQNQCKGWFFSLTNWLVLSDEQKIAIFSYLTNEQMSNWLGVEHQPAKLLWGNVQVPLGEQLSSNGNLRIKKTKEYPKKVSHRFPEGSFWKGNRNEWWDGKWKLWFQTSNICIYIIYIYYAYYVYVSISNPNPCIPLWDSPPKKNNQYNWLEGCVHNKCSLSAQVSYGN